MKSAERRNTVVEKVGFAEWRVQNLRRNLKRKIKGVIVECGAPGVEIDKVGT